MLGYCTWLKRAVVTIVAFLFFRSSAYLLSSERSQSQQTTLSCGQQIESADMSYSSLIKKLYKININHPVKMGLQNSENLYRVFGRPLDNIPIVHVAGTNGKGSVSLKTVECLRKTGFRTGLFVSPHISSFRERIQVDGVPLSEEAVKSYLPEIFEACEKHSIPATFFELTTILAMITFKRANCNAVVLEVGLGGRLDSTNIITPALSVITSIQLDHVKILGDTIEKIAMEKAGIMKPGIDVLVGPGCPIPLLKEEANRVGSPFHTLEDVLSVSERRYQQTSSSSSSSLLSGGGGAGTGRGLDDIDDLNSDIAHAAMVLLSRQPALGLDKLTREDITEAVKVRPPCRFEIFHQTVSITAPGDTRPIDAAVSSGVELIQGGGREIIDVEVEVILDIAHNEDAIVALAKKVKKLYPDSPIRVVLGMSADKDIAKCLQPVLDIVHGDTGRIHTIEARHPRALGQLELKKLLVDLAATTASASTSQGSAVAAAGGVAVGSGAGAHGNNGGKEKDCVVLVPAKQSRSSIRESVREAINLVANEQQLLYNTLSTKQGEVKGGKKPVVPVVIVCGTAFIMSEARAELGVVEPRDGDSLAVAFSGGGSSSADGDGDSDDDKQGLQLDAQEFFGDAYTKSISPTPVTSK